MWLWSMALARAMWSKMILVLEPLNPVAISAIYEATIAIRLDHENRFPNGPYRAD